MSAPTVLVMKQVWRHPPCVSKRESWAPGCGRSRRQDHPHALGPALDLVELGELDDLGALSDPPVELSRAHPVLLLGQQQGVTNRTADGKADRVVEVGIAEGLDEAMRGPGRVGPDQDGVEHQHGVVAFFVAGAYAAGTLRTACSRSSRWSSVSLGAAFPGRDMAAKVSLVLSHHTAMGLNPKPRLYVAAASSFSECTSSRVESKSQIIGPTGGSAAQTRVRAAATASGMARSSAAVVACTAPQAVATEATGPNSSSCSLSTARSARQSAPSTMATPRWVSTTPGSWVCQLIPHSAMASDMASVNPLRSASSAKSAHRREHEVLAVGHHFGATDRSTTVHFQGALRFWFECVCGNKHSSRREGFSADVRTTRSGATQIIEASP